MSGTKQKLTEALCSAAAMMTMVAAATIVRFPPVIRRCKYHIVLYPSRHIMQYWRRYYVKTTPFWRNYVQNTSFWRYNDVIITTCVQWDVDVSLGQRSVIPVNKCYFVYVSSSVMLLHFYTRYLFELITPFLRRPGGDVVQQPRYQTPTRCAASLDTSCLIFFMHTPLECYNTVDCSHHSGQWFIKCYGKLSAWK